MATKTRQRLRHILVPGAGKLYNFKNPRGGPRQKPPPPRDTKKHSKRMLAELAGAVLAANARNAGKPSVEGYHLTIRSEPKFGLPVESLDSRKPDGPKLLGTRMDGDVTVATIFVPLGGLKRIEEKIHDFGNQKTKVGKPKNAPLVARMDSIRMTALRELWGESAEPFPAGSEVFAWEAWLRSGSDEFAQRFFELCRAGALAFGRRPLHFPDRTVVLLYASAKQLAASVEVIDSLAELRKARLDTAEFVELEAKDQAAWAENLAERTSAPPADAPVVCLLDTGVNNGHPLLAPLLPGPNMFAYLTKWGKADHDGHGTEMAGLAGYGDLAGALNSSGPLVAEHGLESVKILPPTGSNPPDLYGSITIDACAQPEAAAPERRRVFSMAVTTTDGRSYGRPSSWSASLDALAAGRDDGRPRLFFVAVGNAERNAYAQYPASNITSRALDPSQAWNVVTVGASTERVIITEPSLAGRIPIAPHGDLSPTSSTSVAFEEAWPAKPDIVLEGGNVALDPTAANPPDDGIDSLRLLTTNRNMTSAPLTTTNATSAATSQAAHLAGQLMAEYPKFWPETIRALMVHSGRWTKAMWQRHGSEPRTLLRVYGHGIPSLDRARWSAHNALTLVVQSTLHPYRKEEASGIKAGQMRLHRLPWPRKALQDLYTADVRLRVTLSYFVEPNPAQRGWKGRYSYASHQLRFAIQRPAESADSFAARVNEEQRAADYAKTRSSDPGWVIGAERDRGSIHADVWHGPATDLATREHIAVYPVGGWWKENASDDRWKREVRYALTISIETDEEEVDLYTPVANLVPVPVEIESE